MRRESLKQLLSQLHVELNATESVDEDLKTLLLQLSDDIHQVVTHTEQNDDPVYSALSERTLALSAKFAAQHPKLEPALRELGGMLERIGV